MISTVEVRAGTREWFGVSIVAATVVPWVAVILAHYAGMTDGRLFAVAAIVAATHVAGTAAFFGDRELGIVRRDPIRYVVAPVAAVVVSLAVAMSHSEPMIVAMILGFQVWQFHHFSRQNLGLMALWCRWNGGASLTGRERRVFDLTTWGGVLGVIHLSLPYGYRLPGGDLFRLAGVLCLAAAAVLVVLERPMPSWRLAGLAAAVVFYLPAYLYEPSLIVATAGYAFAHAAQYFVMMWHLRGGRVNAGRAWVLAVAAAVVVIGLPMRWVGEETVGVWASAWPGLVMGHFIIDAGVWKMRTPEQRAYFGARMPWLTTPRR